jgi:hypothetical protein
MSPMSPMIAVPSGSLITCLMQSIEYGWVLVLLGFVGSISELSISVPSSPGSGGAQAPQSPIPTPDPPTARRSRVYLADPGRVGSPEKGLVIYPWIWMNFWYFHVSELLEFRDGWPYPTMFWPWYWALTFWG